MEELCTAAGGYARFFWTLTLHYFGWWGGVVAVPALFLDHHRCEVRLPYFAWFLYTATLLAVLTMAVLLELSVVQRLGLLRAGELLEVCTERRWQVPLVGTVLWKLDSYTDVVFIYIARDCGSSLWWASLAAFLFVVVFCQLLFNMCFACTDCDHELPSSFGFTLLDFKLVNAAVRDVLPFNPDASHLPVARPVTLRTTSHLLGMEKVMGDVAQVCIQSLFLMNAKIPHGFVIFSVLIGVLHGTLSLCMVLRECVQDEVSLQAHSLQQGTALLPGTLTAPTMQLSETSYGSSEPPSGGSCSLVAPSILGRSSTGSPGADRGTDRSTASGDRGHSSGRGRGSYTAVEELELDLL